MTYDRSGENRMDRPEGADPAPNEWRESVNIVWMTAIVFVGLTALTGVLIEIGYGYLAWLVMLGGVVLAWIAGLVFLVWLPKRR